MNVLSVTSNTPEWMAVRALHDTASEAPAAHGKSRYTSRSDLMKQKSTGLTPEVDGAKQALFNRGHEAEAGARSLAEAILDSELYPITATLTVDGIDLLASLDGATMDEEIIWEHKLYSERLAADVRAGTLDPHYTLQLDQQLLVSGAKKCLFMTSDGTADKMAWCWYESSPEKSAALVAGWKQFRADLAAFVPPAAPMLVVAEPVQALPAVLVQVTGEIAVKDNFAAFETALRDFLEHRLIREPKTDQDFADLDVQIKAMKGAEAALESAETQMLAQVQTIDQAKKTKDMLAKLVRDNRLMAEKLLASEKERRRGEIVQKGRAAYEEHIAALTKETGGPWIVLPPPDFAGKVKGLRTIASMQGAVDDELARVKIVADESARRIRASLACLKDDGAGYEFLFHDRLALIGKPVDDLKLLVKSRIAEHQAEVARKEEETRERIRTEELARIEREQAATQATKEKEAEALDNSSKPAIETIAQAPVSPVQTATLASPAVNVVPMRAAAAPVPASPPATPPTLKLGQIAERLGFALTGEFLKTLGFEPAARDKSALLFHEADFTHICAALVAHIQSVQTKQAA